MSPEPRPALQGVAASDDCGCAGPLHRVTCLAVAGPGAMVNDQGEVFYPDDDHDAAWFAEHHGAYLLRPAP